jgi:hypothetical protein
MFPRSHRTTAALGRVERQCIETVDCIQIFHPGQKQENLAAQLGVVVRGALDNADTQVDRLPILGEDERLFLIESSNDTPAEYPREACVHRLFAEQAARIPDSVAVVIDGASLTYGELDRRANWLAHCKIRPAFRKTACPTFTFITVRKPQGPSETLRYRSAAPFRVTFPPSDVFTQVIVRVCPAEAAL